MNQISLNQLCSMQLHFKRVRIEPIVVKIDYIFVEYFNRVLVPHLRKWWTRRRRRWVCMKFVIQRDEAAAGIERSDGRRTGTGRILPESARLGSDVEAATGDRSTPSTAEEATKGDERRSVVSPSWGFKWSMAAYLSCVQPWGFNAQVRPAYTAGSLIWGPARSAEHKGCNWGMQMIDGCSLELWVTTLSVAPSSLADRRNKCYLITLQSICLHNIERPMRYTRFHSAEFCCWMWRGVSH